MREEKRAYSVSASMYIHVCTVRGPLRTRFVRLCKGSLQMKKALLTGGLLVNSATRILVGSLPFPLHGT